MRPRIGRGAWAAPRRSTRPALDHAALDPVALDPVALDPAALDPVALDPAALDPAALDPAALDHAALDPALDHTASRGGVFRSLEAARAIRLA
ncbi:MAG: hypothetical protein MUE69_06430 [Myxococcota bacterium]|nr:hypothetical protein [Myxococcota bacterium]